jgi:hypothetical protein
MNVHARIGMRRENDGTIQPFYDTSSTILCPAHLVNYNAEALNPRYIVGDNMILKADARLITFDWVCDG